MKKITVCLLGVIFLLLSGCTKVTGNYKEGTYFAYDEATKYSVVMYVDEAGVIQSVFFDSIYLTGCEQRGVLQTCEGVTSKQALGDDYNMRPASAINKEWYEQVNSFAAKVVEEQDLEWLEFKYKDAEGNITSTQPEGKEEKDKVYTDTVAGVTIVVDNLSRLINNVLEQASK
jgi:hypothetical protein